MEALTPGARVERVNSPSTSLIKDGVRGSVRDVLQAANGELGYLIRIDGWPPDAGVFCAGSRLRLINASSATR